MNTKDLMTITTVALGTATLTVAAFWARPIEAGNDADTPPGKVPQPQFVSHGIQMTLAPVEGRTFKAGDRPEFELTAVNTTGEPASASVTLSMTAMAPVSPLSRVASVPSILWQQQQIVSVQPNEKKVLTLSVSTNLPVNKEFSLALREADEKGAPWPVGTVLLHFSTVDRDAFPTFASLE